MRLTLAQINPTIADFEGNLKKIENCVSEALKQNSELVIFPELSLCGYPPLDFLEHPGFLDNCFNSIEKLKKLSLNIDLIINEKELENYLRINGVYNEK